MVELNSMKLQLSFSGDSPKSKRSGIQQPRAIRNENEAQ
jgi:hypothetical protein